MNPSDIKKVLELYNLDSPKKSLGQNFLMNEDVLHDIVKFGDVSKDDKVIEIGPGLGFLSQLLASVAGELFLVELDEKLLEFLKDQLFTFKNIEYIQGDILRVKVEELVKDNPYKVIANIPYNITSRLFRKFTEIPHKPELIVLLIQKEVAERISAEPGKMSVLATVLQFYYNIELKRMVPNTDFYPSPKVNSAVVKLTRRFDREKKLNDLGINQKRLWQMAKMGFAAKRKKLLNNLANGLHISVEELKVIWKKLDWDENRRAQELSVDEWISITKLLNKFLK